jgi:excisionase family DNA binding protein
MANKAKSKSKAKLQKKALIGKEILSITEAAQLNNVTRQAIYVAIKLNKLKAKKDDARWAIHISDLEEYRNNKYSRAKSVFKGELLFDNKKGYYSVNQVADMLDVPPQKIYYATRVGKLKAHRKGAAWVIHMNDVKAYQEKYNDSKSGKLEVC